MNLSSSCKNCKIDFILDVKAESRSAMEDDLGRYFEYECPHCQIKKEYHVNDVWAEKKSIVKRFLIVAAVCVLITWLLFEAGVDLISLAVLLIPLAYYYVNLKSQNRAIEVFNSYQVSRTRLDE